VAEESRDELARAISDFNHRECLHDEEPPTTWETELADHLLDSDWLAHTLANLLRGQAREIRHNWDGQEAFDASIMLDEHATAFEAATAAGESDG
jgi:hypothetical protein